MSKILGLDIGTNSIGWAWLDTELKLITGGVRIFPRGVDVDKGKEASHNLARRTARGIRRGYFRYKLRRKALLRSLEIFGLLPLTYQQTAPELYGLRKRALDERIELHELGRILFHLNQHRGFKSNKKESRASDKADELGTVKTAILSLDQAITDANCRTVGEYFNGLIQKASDMPGWHNPNEPIERIRGRYVSRKMYTDEFILIWENQLKYHRDILEQQVPSLRNPNSRVSLKQHIGEEIIFYQRPLKSARNLVLSCRYEPKKKVAPKSHPLYQEFRLWEQMSKVVLIEEGNEPKPLSFEQKLKIAENSDELVSFKKKDKVLYRSSRTHNEIKSLLNLSRRINFNDVPDIKGLDTIARIKQALGESYRLIDEKQKLLLWDVLNFATDHDWLLNHAQTKLGFTVDQAQMFADIDLEPDYGSLSVKAIGNILPELKKGLRYDEAVVAAGYAHHSYDVLAQSKDRMLEDKVPALKNNELRNPIVQQVVGETIRLVNYLIKHNGCKPDEIKIELARELKKPKKAREEIRTQNLNKEKLREAYRSHLNSVGIRASKTELLKYELFLELNPQITDDRFVRLESLTETKATNQESANTRRSIEEALKDFNRIKDKIENRDNTKFALWLECNRVSPYSGRPIALSQLFSPEIEIEHIVPYSRSLDDSFMNKTLCEAKLNKDKGDRLPYEWLNSSPADWERFKLGVKNFPEGKREKFILKEIPDDFLNSQLSNTAYIALQATKQIKKAIKNVNITNGQATGHLRECWGMKNLWDKDKAGEGAKDRSDHRHHFIDAVVIGATTISDIQLLSSKSSFDHRGRLRNNEIPQPWEGFREQTQAVAQTLLVSYRGETKAFTRRKNPYRWWKTSAQKPEKHKITIAPRGALHKDTAYGKILHPILQEKVTVVRKPVSYVDKMERLEDIVDPKVREVIKEYIEKHGGNPITTLTDKHLENNPLYMYSKKDVKVPIRKIRVVSRLKDLIAIRPNENAELYVNSGNNFLFALYGEHVSEKPKGKPKRDYEIVSLFEAIRRKIKGEPLYAPTLNGLPLLMTLHTNDLVVIFEDNPDEIEWSDLEEIAGKRLYRLEKTTGNRIYLAKHNLANIKLDKDAKPAAIRWNQNTFKGIKVRIDLAGNLHRLDER